MPVPAFNVINGGSHAGNNLAMQEFMILPVEATSFSEALRMGSEVYHIPKGIIEAKYGQDACNVGDEGGFAPNVQDNREGLLLLIDAIEKAGYTGKESMMQIKIGMDVAASEFLTEDGKYNLNFKKQPNDGAHVLAAQSLCDLYKEFVKDFPIVSIEDPFDHDDWSSWASLQSSVDIQLVGDDLLVNQIGTVTESIRAPLNSKAAGWGVMVSHRSGETEDNFIADLSVGLASGQIKTVAPCRSERLTKYNQGVPLYKHIQELAGTGELVMPVPAFNVINGGSHAGNNLAMQEFMILPVEATSFSEALRMGSEVYHIPKGIIEAKYGQDACNVGDEGGFAPNVQDNREGLLLLIDAIEKAGYTGKIKIGMDVAASEFLTEDGKYNLNFKKQPNDGAHVLAAQSLCDLYKEFVKDFPIVSIEDPFDHDDWSSWASLQSSVDIQLVVLKLLVSEVNQIGTVTESIRAPLNSKAAGWGVMVSHRSGETEDNFIADLSVGLASGQIKTVAPCRSERLTKYNQELGNVPYAGEAFRSP
ncbi:unnamed protein product [Ilex paraguariensis]|uniref:phosphopyruvate hydratase n=1 Tax=Ilex paraguariensis TaxID=185542 RepID=A0ABC8S0P1_9AQUA